MQKTIKALPLIQRGMIFAACLFGLASGSAHSAELSVTTLNDSGPGSLREAIDGAAPNDMITIGVQGTITLSSGALEIGENLTIEGPGAKRLTISGNHTSRVFVILNTAAATISGITISDGLANGSSPYIPSIGGGILVGTAAPSSARLDLMNVVVSNNQAFGNAEKVPLGYIGVAYGGGVGNAGTLNVYNSSFIGNLARGSDNTNAGSTSCTTGSKVAGMGAGGAIANLGAGRLDVTGSTFSRNQAIGGNNCSSCIVSGHSAGGAILSGGPAAWMKVTYSGFDHNQAIGGDGNLITIPAPNPAIGPNKASGGAIDVTGGSGTIEYCTLDHNQSIGGIGALSDNGGIGAGGAIVATNLGGFGATATINNSKVEHNKAIGGPGSPDHNGGDGDGGGFTTTSGATLIVTDTIVAHNQAQGGEGGEGGNGGNGLGGGLYDHVNSATPTRLLLYGAVVSYNLALGGEAGNGGSDGQGKGGGVYHLGEYSADGETVITKNQATTSNNNVGP
jgi:hypothetical protein